ncbi:hypothetical protein J3E68DRAFT_444942 [Trichoderma sp. SZMC 28012]
MFGHNAKIHEQNVPQNSHTRGNNQELVNSGQMAISQRLAPGTRKRIRSEDEEEDELAMPTKYGGMRTFAMPGVENWEAFTLSQLARRDPEVVCDLLDATRADLKRHQIKIRSLEAEINREAKLHEEKRIKLINIVKRLRIDNRNLLQEKVEDFGTKKASDDTIISIWLQLSSKIKNIVSNYFTEWHQAETMSTNGIEYDGFAQSQSFDQIPAVRDSIKRRQLWGTIFHHIFSGNSLYHVGNIGRPIARLIADLDPYKPQSPQYLQMISKIKSALDPDFERKVDPNSEPKQDEMIRDTAAQFEAIIASNKLYEFKEDLRRAFSDAWQIYAAMITSKAIFIMQWPQGDNGAVNDYPYDPKTMEFSGIIDLSDAPERVIGVVESPVLWKIGNGDGENFDCTTILCKHSVFQGGEKNEPSTSIWDISSS